MNVVYLIAIFTLVLQSQTRIVCWPLLAAALTAKYAKTELKMYGSVFVIGLLSDLITGRLLGETSILLLALVFTIQYLNQRFKPSLKIDFGAAIVFEILYIILINILHL